MRRGGGGGNGSEGEPEWPWPWPPCDERLCLALPMRVLVPITAVCLGLFVVGVAGNVLTVLVIRSYRDMKTTTNLYLSSMAVSDLLILMGLPFDLYRLWRSRPWIFGQLLCRLSHYLSEGCTYCTILHITALTVERYLAICFPLKAKVVVTKRRVKATIGVLWAFALLSASPFFFLVGVEQPENHTDFSRECKPTPQALQSGLLATMFWVTTCYFVLPVTCLSVLYGCIGRELWRSNTRLRGPSSLLREKGHRQTVRILAFLPERIHQPCPLQPRFQEVQGSSLQAAAATPSCRKGSHRNKRCWGLHRDQHKARVHHQLLRLQPALLQAFLPKEGNFLLTGESQKDGHLSGHVVFHNCLIVGYLYFW
ncbi:motilin receptor isoform X1 [Agelaius phoeniceus]|uniref:motilin receptor isoform X1 n=1 Tax=Agelaius phoeniceus TaxID=39638 RepID=UPI004054C5DD